MSIRRLVISVIACATAAACIIGCGKVEARTIAIEALNGVTHVYAESGDSEAYVGEVFAGNEEVLVDMQSDMTLALDADKHAFAEEGTHFTLEANGDAKHTKTKIVLHDGSVLNKIENELGDDEEYEVITPNVTLSVRGTVFTVKVTYDAEGMAHTEVIVDEGSVHATGVDVDDMIEAGGSMTYDGTSSNGDYVAPAHDNLVKEAETETSADSGASTASNSQLNIPVGENPTIEVGEGIKREGGSLGSDPTKYFYTFLDGHKVRIADDDGGVDNIEVTDEYGVRYFDCCGNGNANACVETFSEYRNANPDSKLSQIVKNNGNCVVFVIGDYVCDDENDYICYDGVVDCEPGDCLYVLISTSALRDEKYEFHPDAFVEVFDYLNERFETGAYTFN